MIIVNGFDALNECDQDIYRQLKDFLQFVMTYPRIQNASDHDKAQLQLELKLYLLAHTQQIEDNFKFQRQSQQKTYSTPPSSYIRWVRTTASDHLSSQYAFAFLICLLGKRPGLPAQLRDQVYRARLLHPLIRYMSYVQRLRFIGARSERIKFKFNRASRNLTESKKRRKICWRSWLG